MATRRGEVIWLDHQLSCQRCLAVIHVSVGTVKSLVTEKIQLSTVITVPAVLLNRAIILDKGSCILGRCWRRGETCQASNVLLGLAIKPSIFSPPLHSSLQLFLPTSQYHCFQPSKKLPIAHPMQPPLIRIIRMSLLILFLFFFNTVGGVAENLVVANPSGRISQATMCILP